jgi:hypothetical protein
VDVNIEKMEKWRYMTDVQYTSYLYSILELDESMGEINTFPTNLRIPPNIPPEKFKLLFF